MRFVADAFEQMHASRTLAPHDGALNDRRWLAGLSFRRTWERAQYDGFSSVGELDRVFTAPRPRSGLPKSEIALAARDKIFAMKEHAGQARFDVLLAIIVGGRSLRDCRAFVGETEAPHRADAILADRLRIALDLIGSLW